MGMDGEREGSKMLLNFSSSTAVSEGDSIQEIDGEISKQQQGVVCMLCGVSMYMSRTTMRRTPADTLT